MARVHHVAKDSLAQCLAENELAASSLSLLAQPALWPALRLSDASSDLPWTTYWSTRLDTALQVEQARSRFEEAFAAFAGHDDRAGRVALHRCDHRRLLRRRGPAQSS